MRCIHQSLQVRPRAEMRIHIRKVGDPVAMIPGAFLARRALHRFVLEDWSEPDRRDPQPLNVIQPGQNALEIAAVVETLAGRIKAGLEAVALEAAAIIRRIAVREPVRQKKVNDLVLGETGAVTEFRACRRHGGRQRKRHGGGARHRRAPPALPMTGAPRHDRFRPQFRWIDDCKNLQSGRAAFFTSVTKTRRSPSGQGVSRDF